MSATTSVQCSATCAMQRRATLREIFCFTKATGQKATRCRFSLHPKKNKEHARSMNLAIPQHGMQLIAPSHSSGVSRTSPRGALRRKDGKFSKRSMTSREISLIAEKENERHFAAVKKKGRTNHVNSL